MNFEHLREFLVLVECSSFTKASRQLHISQSALSKHIAALEAELGSQLVARSHASIEPTPEGLLAAEAAQTATGIMDDLAKRLNVLRNAQHVLITGRLDDPSVSDVLRLASRQLEKQGVCLEPVTPTVSLREALSSESVDLAIMVASMQDKEDESVVCVPFLSNSPVMALMTSSNPLARLERITWANLEHETFIHLDSPDAGSAWSVIEQRCMEAGFQPKQRTVRTTSRADEIVLPSSREVLIYGNPRHQLDFVNRLKEYAMVPLKHDEDFRLQIVVARHNERKLRFVINELLATAAKL